MLRASHRKRTSHGSSRDGRHLYSHIDGEVLRAQPNAVDRESFLDRWYWPHHLHLERMVNDVVARSGCCLIVDCHSFPSIALPYEPDQTGHRAEERALVAVRSLKKALHPIPPQTAKES
jgi:N-formylglutamate amidohydrolase